MTAQGSRPGEPTAFWGHLRGLPYRASTKGDPILMMQAGHYMDDGSGLSGTESLPGCAEKGKAPAEALLRAENLKRKCIKVRPSSARARSVTGCKLCFSCCHPA